jgi:hypothetical protein
MLSVFNLFMITDSFSPRPKKPGYRQRMLVLLRTVVFQACFFDAGSLHF